jgi:hypothetical protein
MARWAKTAAGQAEVQAKQLALPQRLRSVLIMVDGRRSGEDLRRMLGDGAEAALAQLAAQGLVTALAGEPEAAAPASASDRPSAASATKPAAEPLKDRQRVAVRFLTDALGPMGDALALRLERATDEAGFRAAVYAACEALVASGLRSKADELADRYLNDAG